MIGLAMMWWGNRILSIVCGSMGVFCLCESFVAGSIARYAVLFLVFGTALQAAANYIGDPRRPR